MKKRDNEEGRHCQHANCAGEIWEEPLVAVWSETRISMLGTTTQWTSEEHRFVKRVCETQIKEIEFVITVPDGGDEEDDEMKDLVLPHARVDTSCYLRTSTAPLLHAGSVSSRHSCYTTGTVSADHLPRSRQMFSRLMGWAYRTNCRSAMSHWRAERWVAEH